TLMAECQIVIRLKQTMHTLQRLYSAFAGPGDKRLGERAREFKENGNRRRLLANGAANSEKRESQLSELMTTVRDLVQQGMAALLSRFLPNLTFGKIGDVAWQTCVRTAAEGKDLWEVMKVWGTSPTDKYTPGQMQAHITKRFRSNASKPPVADVKEYNDKQLQFIASPEYLICNAKSRRYLFKCKVCEKEGTESVFICNYRDQGGNFKQHMVLHSRAVPAQSGVEVSGQYGMIKDNKDDQDDGAASMYTLLCDEFQRPY
ncbi:hypothetical protein HDU86_003040, partial [Geranomyces michiganensis]